MLAHHSHRTGKSNEIKWRDFLDFMGNIGQIFDSKEYGFEILRPPRLE